MSLRPQLVSLVVFLACIVSTSVGAATAAWEFTAPMNTSHMLHTATLLQSGDVLVVGGLGEAYDSLPKVSTELYSPASNSWLSAAPLTVGRHSHTAVRLSNGKVLVAGGQAGAFLTNITNTVEIYDPATHGWGPASSMLEVRQQHTATLLGSGKVLVAGGHGNSVADYSATAETYDPVANMWSPAGTFADARAEHTQTLLASGKVLVTGGQQVVVLGFNNYNYIMLASAVLYDPVSNSWSSAGTMSAGRRGHTATLLPSGRVLIYGGYDNSGPVTTAELYDPVGNTWLPAGTPGGAWHGHSAVLLPTGKVLGFCDNVTRLYDPATNSWSPAAVMNLQRFSHGSVLLQSGKVLATGGGDNAKQGALLNSSELYDVSADGRLYDDGFDPLMCRGPGSDYRTDDFAGTTLDPTHWIANANTGSITVNNGISLSAPYSSQFPLVVSTGTPIPASGDFSVRWRATYDAYVSYGSGGAGSLVLSNGLPVNGSGDGASVRVAASWQDSGAGLQMQFFSSAVAYPVFTIYPAELSGPHDFEYCWAKGRVAMFVDGVRKINAPAAGLTRPDSLWFGNPSINPSQWDNFTLHYVHVRSLDP